MAISFPFLSCDVGWYHKKKKKIYCNSANNSKIKLLLMYSNGFPCKKKTDTDGHDLAVNYQDILEYVL